MDIFKDIETFFGFEIPKCLKSLLLSLGNDTMFSLKQLTNDNIARLELYIKKNRNSIVFCVCEKSCEFAEYAKLENFDFNFGHKEILLSLPDLIEKMSEARLEKFEEENSSNLFAELSVVLKEMIDAAKKNQNKSKNAFQYSENLKNFATYIFLLCGRTCYETLNHNLPLPATRTILRTINEQKKRITEGVLRCKELLEYLTERNAGTDIWLAEDASGLVSKIEYDSPSDQLIGIVLPFDIFTGCPKRFSSTAANEEEIKTFMKYKKSTLVYIVLAVPLKQGIAPFVLQMYGTDNCFNSQNVLQRWMYTITELKRFGINVRGFSSDGDPRLLSAMRHQLTENIEQDFIQDPIHVGTKLRNRFLRPYGLMPIGANQISVAHLKILIKNVPKEDHGLTASTIQPLDKQNFDSLKKCMEMRVRNALLKHVPDSQGTVFYLQLCHEIANSMMEPNMTPLERVETIFHAVFFLRAWRKWMMTSKYSLQHNFITSNAYLCTELNALNLIRMMKRCRDEGKPELFLVPYCDSQACERAFRQFRSMGTANWTKVNFSLRELLNMVGRLEVQNDLLYTKLSTINISLPKLEAKSALNKIKIYELPCDEDINRSIEIAKRSAIYDASTFGIIVDSDDIKSPGLTVSRHVKLGIEYNDDSDEEDFDYLDEITEQVDQNHMDDEEEIQVDFNMRAYTTITDAFGNEKRIRKSTIVWAHSDGTKKISSDRLMRVQQTSNRSHRNRNLDNFNACGKVNVSKFITVGEWCVFKYKRLNEDETSNDVPSNDPICFGSILGFKYSKAKSVRDKLYKYDEVDLNEVSATDLDVLSSWYLIDENARLVPVETENHVFLNMENYIATLSFTPMVDAETHTLFLHKNELEEIDGAILKLI